MEKTMIPCSVCNDKPDVKCANRMRAHINGLRCGKCNYIYSKEKFYIHSGRSDGFSAHCRTCANNCKRTPGNGKSRTKANKEVEQKIYSTTKWLSSEQRKRYSRAFLRRFYNYPNQCKRRKKKIEFYLSVDEFYSLTSAQCYYCNQTSPNRDYVGIDRVDSNGNYAIDNCVPCCSICNRMKTTYTQDFFLSHILKIADKNR